MNFNTKGLKNKFKSMLAIEDISMNEVNDIHNKAQNTNYTVGNLSQKINNETMRYIEVEQILNELGYDLVWIKRNK